MWRGAISKLPWRSHAEFRPARFLICLLVLAGFSACRRNPDLTSLTPDKQIQVLIYQDLAGRFHPGRSELLFFLACGQRHAALADPAPEVQAVVNRSNPQVRPYSAGNRAVPSGEMIERTTGRRGLLLIVEPFSTTEDGPIASRGSYLANGKFGKGFIYRVKRVNGRWKIEKREDAWDA